MLHQHFQYLHFCVWLYVKLLNPSLTSNLQILAPFGIIISSSFEMIFVTKSKTTYTITVIKIAVSVATDVGITFDNNLNEPIVNTLDMSVAAKGLKNDFSIFTSR